MAKLLNVNTTFATYKIGILLGEGGSGRVYSATDDTGNDFAIKVLDKSKATTEKLKRFKNEYLFCSNSKHPNILKVVDNGLTDDGNPFFVMPKYHSSIRSIIGSLTPNQAMEIGKKILDGIDASHKHGVFHRDLKPENILINKSSTEVVIADFGIAHFDQEELYTAVETKATTRLANFVYASPEQKVRNKQVDKRADIYAAGLILNELFTSEVPHGTSFKKIAQVSSQYSYLDQIVDKMLCQNPSDRYSSIDEIKLDIMARSNEQVSLQKLDELKNTVIPESELNDPIISTPMKIVDAKWEDQKLSIKLNHVVNAKWKESFINMGSHSSLMGYGPERFQFNGDSAFIMCESRLAQDIINYFKGWLPQVHNTYEYKLKIELENLQRNRERELKEKIKKEEEKLKVNSNLKF